MNVELVPEGAPPRASIVLFFPRFRAPQYPVWHPLEIMTVGTALWSAGYRVRILDDRIEPRAEEILLEEARDALFVGFSARPGDQPHRAVEVMRAMKRIAPHTPTVFGGWFPSGFPAACLADPAIDVVVRGQGERSAVELADRLLAGEELDGLRGVHFSRDGAPVLNPERPLESMDATPRIPFERFPLERYITFDKCLGMTTSQGCVGSCSFCSISALYRCCWSGYSAGRVLDDIQKLVELHGLRILKLHDADFFGNLERVVEICRGLVERDLGIRWIADARIRDMIRFDEELWELLRRSGCAEIETGGESGSEARLVDMGKECTREEIVAASRLCLQHDIIPRINFIVGWPDEDAADLKRTVGLIDQLFTIDSRVRIQLYRFTPWPTTTSGVDTWAACRRGNTGKVPSTLEELLAIPINHDEARMFWVSRSHERRVKRMFYFYLPLVYNLRYDPRPGLRRSVVRSLIRLGRWRAVRAKTIFPFEPALCRVFKRSVPRTSEFEWQQVL